MFFYLHCHTYCKEQKDLILFKNTCNIVRFLIFYIFHKRYNMFFHFNLSKNYWRCFSIILSFISYLSGENKLRHSQKLWRFHIKSMYPMVACILKIFVMIFLFPTNFCWNMFNSEAIKVVRSLPFTYKAIQRAPIVSYSSRFITYFRNLCLINYFLSKHH